jgi:carboxypeptidase Q
MRLRLSLVLLAAAALTAIAATDLLRAQAPGVQDKPAAPSVQSDAPAAPLTAEEQAALAADQKLIAEAKDHSEIMKNLEYLSDVIGPRLTGSKNLEKANKWAAEKMQEYGLENVHQEPWTIPVGWERGTASLKIIEPDNGKSLTVASWAWTPGTNGPVEGDVVIFRPTSKEDLGKYKGKLKNAIVLQTPPSPVPSILEPRASPFGGGRRGGAFGKAGEKGGEKAAGKAEGKGEDKAADKGDDKAGGRRGGFGRGNFAGGGFVQEAREFLRAEGAACVLQDSGKPHGLLNMSGSWRRGFGPGGEDRADAPEPLPNLCVTHDHYALLWRLASRPDMKVRLRVEITNTFIPGPITCYNTVGEVRGSEKPDEYVVCGAHLDSWDLGQGTTDNGTGSCVVLETARILAKMASQGIRPKRTVRFILFTGEEEGLHGSRNYVQAHKDDLPKTSVALVHDTGTGKVQALNTVGVEEIKTIFDKDLASGLKPLGAEISIRGGFGGGGSDHASFQNAGVPGILFSQDRDEYSFTHHSQSDTFDKAKKDNLVQGAQVMSVAALRIANLPSLLPRTPVREGRGGRGGQ